MTGVFYLSVRLRLLDLLYNIDFTRAKQRKNFHVLNSDKTWVFDQSERAQGPIYIHLMVFCYTLIVNINISYNPDIGSSTLINY